MFEDTNDSGISESSISSEIVKAKSRRSQDIRIKHERESSTESSISQRPSNSNKKRKNSDDTEIKVSKKIKAEPVTDDDDPEVFVTKLLAANEKMIPCSSKKEKNRLELSLSKEKKSEKKKKPLIDEEDDFETSLQLIINAGRIKKEK